MMNDLMKTRLLTTGKSTIADECFSELAAAIIRQAVKDYETVLIRLIRKPARTKRIRLEAERVELEVFFHSPWYETLTDIDGDRVIEAARRHAVEKEKAAIRRRLKRKLKKMGQAACASDE